MLKCKGRSIIKQKKYQSVVVSTQLTHLTFERCTFQSVTFQNQMTHCRFHHCIFRQCRLEGQTKHCTWKECELEDLFFSQTLSHLKFYIGTAIRMNFDNTKVKDLYLERMELKECIWTRSRLDGLMISRCILKGANFDDACLRSPRMKNSSLSNSSFSRMTCVDFLGKHLRFDTVRLDHATLGHCKLQKGSFRRVNFRETTLSHSEWSFLSVKETVFPNVEYSTFIRLKIILGHFERIRTNYVEFVGCTFSKSSFEGATLENTSFIGMITSQVIWKDALLKNVKQEAAKSLRGRLIMKKTCENRCFEVIPSVDLHTGPLPLEERCYTHEASFLLKDSSLEEIHYLELIPQESIWRLPFSQNMSAHEMIDKIYIGPICFVKWKKENMYRKLFQPSFTGRKNTRRRAYSE